MSSRVLFASPNAGPMQQKFVNQNQYINLSYVKQKQMVNIRSAYNDHLHVYSMGAIIYCRYVRTYAIYLGRCDAYEGKHDA
jgi:hypothetical protein